MSAAFFRLFQRRFAQLSTAQLLALRADIIEARHEIDEFLNNDIEWSGDR